MLVLVLPELMRLVLSRLATLAQLYAQLAPALVHASLARLQQCFTKDIASVRAPQARQTSTKLALAA